MNRIHLNRLFNKFKANYLLKIFVFVLFVSLNLNNYLYETNDYFDCPAQINNELVTTDQPKEELLLTTYSFYFNEILDNVCKADVFHSYKIALDSYNHLVLVKFKILISNPIFNSNIISILQNNNIWHKSSDEEPNSTC